MCTAPAIAARRGKTLHTTARRESVAGDDAHFQAEVPQRALQIRLPIEQL
jgi:hypothetical protein